MTLPHTQRITVVFSNAQKPWMYMAFSELIDLRIHSYGASYLESKLSIYNSTLGIITSLICY